MLVLKRKYNEVIILKVPASTTEQEIEMKVLTIRKDSDAHAGSVQLGFTAPNNVKIVRAELVK